MKIDYSGVRESLDALIPTTEELIAGVGWYWRAHEFCLGLGPIYQSAGVLAALSPQTPWHRNKELAERYMKGDYLPHMQGWKAIAIVEGEAPDDVLGGHKVRSFYRAVMDPEADGTPVIDQWMLRAMGWDRRYYPKPCQYRKLAAIFSEWADDRVPGHPIHAAQAAVWLKVRGGSE